MRVWWLWILLAASPLVRAEESGSGDPHEARLQDLLLRDIVDSDPLAGLRGTAERLIERTREWSRRVRERVIEVEARAVAQALMLPVLIAEITFTGMRIMMRASIVDQLSRLTLTTFLLILVLTGVPQAILLGSGQALEEGGRRLGGMILREAADYTGTRPLRSFDPVYAAVEAGQSGGELEPVYYWCAWLGSPPSKAQLLGMGADMAALPVDSATEFKMGISSIMRRIWNARDDGRPPPQDGSSPTAWSKIVDALQRASQSFLQTFFIFSLFLACLGVAAVQAGAYLTVVIATLSILTASVVTFDIVLALGYATLPLIYFRSFDRLWSQYLIVCVALALIPCFFYVFSAIGFVFATSTFEILFPLSDPATAAGGASFSTMLTSIFLGAAYTLVSCSHGILPQAWGTMFGNTVSMAEGMVFFGKMFVGSLIVATFVGIGTSFVGLAPLIATRWNSGFGGEQVFTSVRTGIGLLRETLPSQIAQVYSGGIEQAQAMANAAGRTAGTLISKWRRK